MQDRDLERIEGKLDSILERLVSYQQRLTEAETHIQWLRGSVRVSLSLLLSAVTAMAGYIVFGPH